jgi:hypothetical protein
MSTFQERINQFRGGLDAQQSHFNDAMGDAMEYGKHYVADKLGQHYENIEKIGGATLSGALTAGSAINKFKEIRKNLQQGRQTKGMKKTEAPAGDKPPAAPETVEPRTETKAPAAVNQEAAEPQTGSKVEGFIRERKPGAAEADPIQRDTAGPAEAPSSQERLSKLASDADELPIKGEKTPAYNTEAGPPLPPSRQPAPVETAEPSFADQMASLRSQVQSIGKQSGSLTPADTEALNQRTAQQLQSLGGRQLGGAGTNDPELLKNTLLQESDLGQRTAGLGSSFTPRPAAAAAAATSEPKLQGIPGVVFPKGPAPPLPPSRTAPTGQEVPNPAFSAGGKGNAVEAPRTGAGKPPEAQASAAVQDAQDAASAAAKGTTSAIAQAGEFKSAAVSAAGGAAEIAAGAVGGALGGKGGVKGDIGDAAQGGLALKQAASAGQTIAQKAGLIKSSAQQATTDLGDKAPSYLDQATAYAKGQVSDAMDAVGSGIRNVAGKVMSDAAIEGAGEIAGAAMTAIPIIGDLAGAGMLIYGLVKDIKEQKKKPNPQQVETSGVAPTEQAGGIDTRALGGSQQTGSGIV